MDRKPTRTLKTLSPLLLSALMACSFSVYAKKNDLIDATPLPVVKPDWNAIIGLNYQAASNNSTNFASTTDRDHNINTNHHIGYDIGLEHHIAEKDSDIAFIYHYLRTNDSSRAHGSGLVLDGNYVDQAHGKIEYQFASAELTAGHRIPLTNTFGTRMYGGLNYTHLEKNMTFTGTDFMDVYTIRGGTDFRGIGPEFGMDAECNPIPSVPQFGVEGGIKTSFPYGRLTSYNKDYENSDLQYRQHIPSESKVIPTVGAKIGIRYDNSNWGASLGYQSNTFIGATRDSGYGNSNVNTSIQGLYFNVNAGF